MEGFEPDHRRVLNRQNWNTTQGGGRGLHGRSDKRGSPSEEMRRAENAIFIFTLKTPYSQGKGALKGKKAAEQTEGNQEGEGSERKPNRSRKRGPIAVITAVEKGRLKGKKEPVAFEKYQDPGRGLFSSDGKNGMNRIQTYRTGGVVDRLEGKIVKKGAKKHTGRKKL